ncbi:MAG: PD40 domain-containing protein [Mucilaginibacter polytrichastri]|nr:PD40 domain-containing protein [Mucilaginibacter polytrichastri]
MKKLFSLLFFLLPLLAVSQARPYSTKNGEALKWYANARKSVDLRMLQQASNQLDQALSADPNFVEAWYLKGDVNRLLQKDDVALIAYQKVIALRPGFDRRIYMLTAEMEIASAQYEPALQHLEAYAKEAIEDVAQKRKVEKLLADCRFSIRAIKNPVAFKPVNIGNMVNSPADEYLPVITADQSVLIFTRRERNNEDFYQSTRQNGGWSKAAPLSAAINTPQFNEGAQSLSQDGQYLFFTGCNRPDGLGRCDIFLSKKSGDDWEKPFNLGSPVNTSGWESQPCISADGRTLYFVSNRKGGYGGYDIWKTTVGANGWSEPVNLGPTVNTPYNEQSPFVHPDGKTLYFCSDGWPGLGKADLFLSRLDEKGNWGRPENLGYPINSSGEENGLTITADGRYAFFASNKLAGKGGYDIYTFELPESARPKAVTYVKGVVRAAGTNEPLVSAVRVTDLSTGEDVYDNYTSEQGEFLATLIPGKNYGLIVEKENYLFHTENFAPESASKVEPYQIAIRMNPIAVGSREKLSNIFFDTNSFALKPESKNELEKLASFMQQNAKVSIEVSGHTDDIGDDAANQKLSENRAKAVYDFLISRRISATRLTYKGYGKSKPVVPNISAENRQKNRRTEFAVTGF